MPNPVLYRREVFGQGAVDPGSLPYLELRLSGSSLAGAAADPVPTWADQSGNGRTAIAGPNQPALSGLDAATPNAPTGRLGVWFNSFFNVYMEGAFPSGGLDPSRGFTAYCWFWGGPNNAAHEQVLFEPAASGARLVYADGAAKIGWVDQLAANASSVSRSTGYHSLVYAFNPPMGTGMGLIYHNGTPILEATWGFTGGFGPKTGYTLAALAGTGGNAPFEGVFYEFDLFSQAHSLLTIQRSLLWGHNYWGF